MIIPVLEARSLSKSFGPVRANHEISFAVKAGELLCLFGENGAGKSTVSACLTGLFPPDSGDILFKGEKIRMKSAAAAIKLGIGLVHQHFVLVPDFTVLENIIIGSERSFAVQYAAAETKLRKLCETYEIEIGPNARVRDLSVSEQQWVELLKALYFDADVLILDEPTATLDIKNSRKLFQIIEKLKADNVALIIITHKLNEVMQSDRVVVLRQGKVAGIRDTRATNPEELTQLMVGREIARAAFVKTPVGAPRLVLDKVTVAGKGDVPDLDDLTLTVHEGEIFGIAGVAGNGQNALMEVIAGVRKPSRGRLALDGHDITYLDVQAIMAQGLGHIPDDRFREGLVSEFSIAENLILGCHRREFAKGIFIDQTKMQDRAQTDMKAFQVSAPSIHTPVGNLSGGNAQRVILAREFHLSTKVLLANQPTRGLDVGVIEYIYERLLEKKAAGVAIILASAELEDLLTLCDRIGVMFQGRLVGVVDTASSNLSEIGLLMAGHQTGQAA